MSSWAECRASSDIDIRQKNRISSWGECRASYDIGTRQNPNIELGRMSSKL
ncbi:hypothetical protein DPMN_018100 [Dreissena polymorpha]|uniref:Uncharacterized protein n=1 Tax=Dreissena polymorpha TaxID=45954 RepID=A0A9D4NCM2_DREPO|nr:hypothetical protein DPMN_018100 [Dreissena polymorpha]